MTDGARGDTNDSGIRPAHLARNTALVMGMFALAKAISLLQTVIIARAFGVSAEYDAFVAANRLPEAIFNLIAGGAIAFAFIPVFSGLLAKQDTRQAWRTASHLANTVFSLTLIVSAAAYVLAPWLIGSIIAPGFDADGQALAVQLMRILLLSTVIFSISGIAMGILQSFNRFLLPALAPVLFDVGILIGVIVLLPIMGIYGLAWGAVLGAALHLLVQVPGLIRVRLRWSPEFGWRDSHFRRIIILFLPRIADLALLSLTTLLITNILSRLGEGATSAYDWGWRLMQIPETLIGTAMGIVVFPTLAALSALNQLSGKRDALSGSMRFIIVATIPSAVLLIVAGRPMLSLLEGGAFDAEATDLVYATLVFFSVGIIFHSLLEVLARSFFADKDTLTPFLVACGGAALNIGIALLFTGVLTNSAEPADVSTLALANTAGVAFEVIVLGLLLSRRWAGIRQRELLVTTGKTLVTSGLMGIGVIAVSAAWNALSPVSGTLGTIGQLALSGLAALTIYIGAAYIVHLDEVKTFITQSLLRLRAVTRRGEVQAPA